MGYIGYSRSERSQEAIENYEVPIAMITRALINEIVDGAYSDEETAFLKSVSVLKWKYIAGYVSPASWHHTGSKYRRTNHYRLSDIARRILESRETLDSDYAEYVKYKKEEKNTQHINYAVCRVQVWGGTRKHPKIVGYDQVAGIVIGSWLYFTDKNCRTINKYSTTARKTEFAKYFKSYSELVKSFPEYKGTKKIFNYLVKEKGAK